MEGPRQSSYCQSMMARIHGVQADIAIINTLHQNIWKVFVAPVFEMVRTLNDKTVTASPNCHHSIWKKLSHFSFS